MHDRGMKALQRLQQQENKTPEAEQSILRNDPKPPEIGVDPRPGNHQHTLTDEDPALPPRHMFRKAEADRSDNEWAYVRMAILDAHRPFPGAREAVVSTLIERSMHHA